MDYTWQISTPNIGTGIGVVSSAYNDEDGKNVLTTITASNPSGFVKAFPNTSSTDLNIKNLEFVIRTDGQIVYRVLDGTQNPQIYDSLQALANRRGGWTGATTTTVQSQINSTILAKVDAYNRNNPNAQIGPGVSNNNDDEPPPTDLNTAALPEQIDIKKTKDFGTLIYPEKIEKNGQDFIQFKIFEYISQKLSSNNLLFDPRGEYKDSRGTIILPIQPNITDTNTVSWGESKLGILEMMGANIGLSGMNAGSNYLEDMANKFGQTIAPQDKITPEIVTAVQNYLAKMAISSNTNLLSRTGGAVTNPNLTLLFESPDLRNFTFNFKLTPRTEKEGTVVRKIIRVFKQYMAVQRSAGNLFLETPNVFDIKYIRGDDIKTKKVDTHKSLNLFKTCALRNFTVNYTPSNTYMTYNDVAGTMTSYELSMSFTELDPIYYDDYEAIAIAEDSIGY